MSYTTTTCLIERLKMKTDCVCSVVLSKLKYINNICACTLVKIDTGDTALLKIDRHRQIGDKTRPTAIFLCVSIYI